MSENGARHELADDPYPSCADQPGDRYADGPWAHSDYVPDTSKALPAEVGHAVGEWARQQDAYPPNQFPEHDRDAARELADRDPGALERYEHGLPARDELKNISTTGTQRPAVPPPGWLSVRASGRTPAGTSSAGHWTGRPPDEARRASRRPGPVHPRPAVPGVLPRRAHHHARRRAAEGHRPGCRGVQLPEDRRADRPEQARRQPDSPPVITMRNGPEDRTINPEAFVHESGPAPGGVAGFACFSPDRRYRWSLRRAWPGNGPAMTFVMLNPSTAGATEDDATIRRCRGFAEREGCTSFEVVNLFALVSTSPAALLSDPDPVGAASDQFIADACTGRDNRTVVVAWGANADRPRLLTRANQVLDLLDEHEVAYRALGITAGGHPVHPLRLRKDTPLQRGLRRRAGRRDHGGRKSGMSIYEREGETYRALQINGPDDGPAGAGYIVRRDSDARFGGYIVDTAKDGQAHPADPGPDADDLPYRFEAYDDAGRYVASGQSLRGAVSVFSHQGRARWIQDRQPDREAGS